MKNNVGTLDKTVRVLAAVAFTVLFFTGHVSGILAIIGFMAAGLLLLTSLISYCPVYDFFEIRTCKRETNRAFRNWN